MKTLPFISLLFFAVPASTASANLLIVSDNFNTANPGLNDDLAARQSGSLAPTNWLVGADSSGNSTTAGISGNQLLFGLNATSINNETNVTPDQDFALVPTLVGGGEFKVSFDVTPAGSYASFSLGATTGELSTRPLLSSNTDLALLMSPSGNLSVYQGGSSIHAETGLNWAAGAVELTVGTTGFSAGTPFTVDMTLGGTPVDLTGTGPTFNGTWDANGSNYMILSDRNGLAASTFDNFSVIAIPEPSTLLLVLIPVLSLVVRRRK